jgi:hypothetical protein
MGLEVKTSQKESAVAAASAALAATATAATAVEHVFLTPALYDRYVRKGHLFEKGTPYRVTREQADVLLAEVEDESDRPLWRVYKPAATPQALIIAEAARGPAAVDMTGALVEDLPEVDANADSKRRLEVGDDSEIAEILADAGVAV